MSKPHIGMEEGEACALLDRYDTGMLEILSCGCDLPKFCKRFA